MPNSIDISTYEKAPFLEDLGRGDISTSPSSDDGDDTTPMLGKAKEVRSTRRLRWLRSPWMFFLDFCLVALVVIFAGRKTNVEPVDLQGDITGLVPRFNQKVTTFRSHPEFVSNHTSLDSLKEAQEAWVDLLPRGQGYITLSDSDVEKHDLPTPVDYKGGRSLGTSWMHGLHCLYLVMSEYDMLAMGMRQPGYDTWHMDHCIDYIRQLIICSGDMALAGGDLPGGSSFLNVPHVCKNYEQMYEYLENKRDNDAYQFGTHETHYVPP